MQWHPHDVWCSPRGHVLGNTVTSPSRTIWPPWEGQTGKKQNKQKNWKSKPWLQDLLRWKRKRGNEYESVSIFSPCTHIWKHPCSWYDVIHQLMVCWPYSCVFCLSHQPPPMGLHVLQCVLGWSVENCKRMEWKNKKAQVLAHHLLTVRLKISSKWMCTGWNKILHLWLETQNPGEMWVIFEERGQNEASCLQCSCCVEDQKRVHGSGCLRTDGQ